jgi:tetratricopeptide (TPR) repeat protein
VKCPRGTYAESLYQQALILSREIGNRLGEANALKSLGDVKSLQRAYAEAEGLYSKAIEIYASIGDRNGQRATLLSLATVYHALGDQEKARSLADQARELHISALQIPQQSEHFLQELS